MRIITLALVLVLYSALSAPAVEQQWPDDARDVAFAIASRATAQPGPANITFAPGVEAGFEGAATSFFASFQAGRIVLVSYANHGTGSVYDAEVAGVLNLVDPNDRIVALQFGARYTVNGQDIVIKEAATVTSSPNTVLLEVHLVPVDAFTNIPYEVVSDWNALYKLARENAYLPPKEGAPADTYMVMTFVKNRIPPDANFEAIVSSSKTARRTQDNSAKSQERYMDYQGWRVHMFAAKFSPTSTRDRFYINYYYTPGSGMPESERDRIQVARYDSKPSGERQALPQHSPVVIEEAPATQPDRSHITPEATSESALESPAPPAPMVAPAPAPYLAPAVQTVPASAYAPSASEPAVGPLEKGLAFLNPVFPEDVELIQKRLQELGLYKGSIDKTFGPQTKRALDHYAVGQGFPKGQWSLGLQKALFAGTGQ
ncbi:MAG: peptidoglycan-binding domain-containing protein [Pseudomonadota bacterium]